MPYAKDHKAKTRDRIVASATELFSRCGFDKVSIAEIMKSAKMTHGAFYAHFESKEALFKASFFETLKASRAARLVKGPLSLKHLTELVSNYLSLRELEKNKPGPEAILLTELGQANETVAPVLEESYLRLKKMIETRLLALSRLKQLPLANNKALIAERAVVIMSLLVGGVALARAVTSESERQGILEAAQNQILQLLGVQTISEV